MDTTQTPDPALVALGIKPDLHPPVRIRMGEKKKEGFGVVGKGMFHLCDFRAVGNGTNARSVPHASFGSYNGAPEDRRRTLWGNLVHAQFVAPQRLGTIGACYTRFRADTLPGIALGSVQGNRPACTGDGVFATRWNPRTKGFDEIGCPGDLCEFRQADGDNMPPCKRSSSLVFQLRWPAKYPFPCLNAFIETAGSWSFASQQWWGFYTHIKQQWAEIVGDGSTPDVYGLPIRLQLVERTSLGSKRKQWVPELSLDFEEGKTLQDFLLFRSRARRETRSLITSDRTPLSLPDYGAVEAVDATYEPVERPGQEAK